MTAFIQIIPEWFELVSLAFCIGALVCLLWVLKTAGPNGSSDQGTIFVSVWRLFGICLSVMVVSSIAELLMRAAEMSGRPVSEVFPVLGTVIFRSHAGRVWLIRMAAVMLLLILLKAGRTYRDSRGFLLLVLGLMALISMTESASGHASDKGDFSLPEIMDWLHLLAASVWGGGLLALSAFVLPGLVISGDEAAPLIAGVARRFSAIAGVAVGIVALTSLYNAWSNVNSLEAFWKAPYGRIVLIKIVLFFLLLGLGAFNRYVNVPLLQEWAGISLNGRGIIGRVAAQLRTRFLPNKSGPDIALRFKRSVRLEALLIIGVLLCAGLLRHQVPARHFLHLQHMAARQAAPPPEPVVSLETYPDKITAGVPVGITVRITDPEGKHLGGLQVMHERILHAIIIGKDLNVFAHIHPEDFGRVTDEMMKEATFPLRFTFPKAGQYLVGIDFAASDEAYSKSFPLSVSGEPAMGEPKMDLSREKDVGEYRITLTIFPDSVQAGEETTLRYVIEKNGRAVTDLKPYLGAAMHLAVVSTDLSLFIHAHGATPGEPRAHHDHMHANPPKRFGPEIDADIVFPGKGIYKIFSQVKHGEKVLLFDFMVNVQ